MFARGFLIPTKLIQAIVETCTPQDWPAIFVAGSGTFRTERGLTSVIKKPLEIHSNDVSLLSTALARAALGDPLSFRFTGELAFVEDLGLTDPAERLAAILVALDYSSYARGKRTRYNISHVDHLRCSFGVYARELRDKMRSVIEAAWISGYFAGDFRDHIETAIARGAGVIAYPPASGDEKMKYVDANTDWQRPSYRIFDPRNDVKPVLERLSSAGIPYFLYIDQMIEGFEPVMRFEQPGKGTFFGYGRGAKASYRAALSRGEPFHYNRFVLDRVHSGSKLWIIPAPEAHIAFLREAFLSKRIAFGSGDYSVKVMIDDMLVGAISYRKMSSPPLYVLTDLVVTREGRLAKLVARLATCRPAFRGFEHKLLKRFKTLSTHAFSEHPDAMKYRGSWKLVEREGEPGDWKIHYVSEVRDETFDQCFAWWWTREGEKLAAARIRDQAAVA